MQPGFDKWHPEKWLIIGLGNPGSKYQETRHNIGFMVTEALARHAGLSGREQSKMQAIVGTGQFKGASGQSCPVVIAQPTTFMNLSGEAVAKLLAYYDISPKHLLVVYDEAAIPFGKIRVRPHGSAGGHNGMKSIIQSLGGNQDFPRLRVGIGLPENKQIPLEDYVLAKFTPDEKKQLDALIDTSLEAICAVIFESVETAMNRFNGDAAEKPSPEKPAAKDPDS